MDIRKVITECRKLFEADEVFKAASPHNIAKRLTREEDAIKASKAAFTEKVTRVAQAAGFTFLDAKEDNWRRGPIIRFTKGEHELTFTQTALKRVRVCLRNHTEDPKTHWRSRVHFEFYASTTASDKWLIREINDKLIAKSATGDEGWAAKYLTSMRYKKYCQVCNADIPSNTKFLRSNTGTATCLDCIRKAAKMLPESIEWLVRNNMLKEWMGRD